MMTIDEWVDKYVPIKKDSETDDVGYSSWETYGDDLEYVMQQDSHNVWTEVDDDDGVYIIAGYHLVNRIQYFICQNAWTDGVEDVCVCEYKECSCNIEGVGLMGCFECKGDGYITDWKN